VHPGEGVVGGVEPLQVGLVALGVCACAAGVPIAAVMKIAPSIASAPLVSNRWSADAQLWCCRIFVMNFPFSVVAVSPDRAAHPKGAKRRRNPPRNVKKR
jgi:hypothetical protein